MIDDGVFWKELPLTPLIVGGERYWTCEQALRILRFIDAKGLAVIGVEGHIFTAKGVCNDLETLADFSSYDAPSWASFRRACSRATERILLRWSVEHANTQFMVTLTILGSEEWLRR